MDAEGRTNEVFKYKQMIQKRSPLEAGKYYNDNTEFGKFMLYKIIYPVVNAIGLNRRFNLLIHRLGYYAENSNGLCQWCGHDHRVSPLSEYREIDLAERMRKIEELYKETV